MRTTTADKWPFSFTISDLARFLGKSPVTIRGWEKRGLVSIPRDPSGDRKLNTADIHDLAVRANELGRIDDKRLRLIGSALTILELIEQ